MARPKAIRLLAYDALLVPEAGYEVLCSVAGPLSISHKEPAGHKFHSAILKQSGLLSESMTTPLLAPLQLVPSCQPFCLVVCRGILMHTMHTVTAVAHAVIA